MNNILQDLGPLYHSYSFFGVDNKQKSSSFVLNQQAKSPVINAYIGYAAAESESFTELFCADGYYAMVAASLGCSSIGIDRSMKHSKNLKAIAERLNLDVTFLQERITPNSEFSRSDTVANVGGLYHVDEPESILSMSYHMACKYLIVQSVVSLESTDSDYFVKPAPGRQKGNRFTRQSFDKMVRRVCDNVVFHHFNELKGNKKKHSRGSAYYLIKK